MPEPFVVQIEPDFIATIPDAEIKALAAASSGWAFGLRKLPPQFATIPADVPFREALIPTAAEILAFDLLIANPDRRVKNPNCLTNGKELAIYDHELAFLIEGVIGWSPPWQACNIRPVTGPDRHVFLDAVRGQNIDLSRLRGALEAITPARVEEYRAALPADWLTELAAVRRILAYIHEIRDNAVAMHLITAALS